MRQAPLPFITLLEDLVRRDPKQADEIRTAATRELIASSGFQLILSILQTIDSNALSSIKNGFEPERNIGRLQAVEEIRRCIRALLPVEDAPDMADQVEEDVLPPYTTGFSIPTGE